MSAETLSVADAERIAAWREEGFDVTINLHRRTAEVVLNDHEGYCGGGSAPLLADAIRKAAIGHHDHVALRKAGMPFEQDTMTHEATSP